MNAFQEIMVHRAQELDSRLVFALDMAVQADSAKDQEVLMEDAYQVCGRVERQCVAVKVGRHFIDSVGYLNAAELIKEFKGLPFIADLKLAHGPEHSLWMARHAFVAGFGALTAHAFVGRDPLDQLVREFAEKGVIVTVDMRHASAKRFLLPLLEEFCKLSKQVKASGIQLPAVKKVVSRAHSIIKSSGFIFASGLTEKTAGSALSAGADFEIIGRDIYNSRDPSETSIRIVERMRGTYGPETEFFIR